MKQGSSLLAIPSVIYLIVWAPLILISKLDVFFFSVKAAPLIEAFVTYLIFNFFLVYGFSKLILKRRQKKFGIHKLEIYALRQFTINLFKFWVVGFCINVAFSGGLPTFWVLMGDERAYSDFGIPTFSGFFNMIRMFLVIALVLCAIHKEPIPKYITYVLIFSFCAELNRASIFFAVTGSVSAFLLFNKLRFRNFWKMSMVVVLFVASFTFIGEFREQVRGDYADPRDYFTNNVGEFGAVLYIGLYFLTPLNNLYYQYDIGIEPTYTPYYTLSSILPTVIREQVFTDKVRSTQLASDAFNTSPYVADIISDYGFVGGLYVITIIQFLICYVFVRASRRSLEHSLMYCVLWGATLISVFTNLYFSLIVLAFPLLIAIFSRYKKRYIIEHGRRHF